LEGVIISYSLQFFYSRKEKEMEEDLQSRFPVCDQCGFTHPPLRPGQKCPAAESGKEEIPEVGEVDLTDFIVSMKNILVSQIQSKKIKDVKKLTSFTIVEITKILEGYKEE